MHRYEMRQQLGEGTFGVVFEAIHKKSQRRVAIKRVKRGKFKDGVEFTALREMKLQMEIKHPHVVELIEAFSWNDQACLVFEYLEGDLEAVIKAREIVLSAADIKSYMRMLLDGLHHLNSNWILHRDLKPGNLLLAKDGKIKIADFGLAKMFGSPNRNMTSNVVTLWYRAPELLYGAREYGAAVDVWSAGCIFAELMLRGPFLAGNNELDQLGKIFHALGTPTEEQWPGMSSLPNFVEFSPCPGTPLKQIFTAASEEAIDLLGKMLVYNPGARITAGEALKHPYFAKEPTPTPPEQLPKLPAKQSQP